MGYLAVNKDESERIFNEMPQRCEDIIYNEDDVFPSGRHTDKKYFWGIENYGYYTYEIDYGIELPKGTIELLIGRKLTWKNKPIKFVKLKSVK